MKAKFVVRPSARDDIIRQFRWYLVEKDAAVTAHRFLDAVEESVEQLRRMPNMGAPKTLGGSGLEGLRSWPVKGFEDIRIYYLVQGTAIRVLRILHGRRDLARILKRELAN